MSCSPIFGCDDDDVVVVADLMRAMEFLRIHLKIRFYLVLWAFKAKTKSTMIET